MTIDLKWLLPFAMPFAILALIRAVLWAAGASLEDYDPAAIAAISIFFGVSAGIIAAGVMEEEGHKWNVHIGVKRHD